MDLRRVGGQRVCCPPSNYWGMGGLAPPLPMKIKMVSSPECVSIHLKTIGWLLVLCFIGLKTADKEKIGKME